MGRRSVPAGCRAAAQGEQDSSARDDHRGEELVEGARPGFGCQSAEALLPGEASPFPPADQQRQRGGDFEADFDGDGIRIAARPTCYVLPHGEAPGSPTPATLSA